MSVWQLPHLDSFRGNLCAKQKGGEMKIMSFPSVHSIMKRSSLLCNSELDSHSGMCELSYIIFSLALARLIMWVHKCPPRYQSGLRLVGDDKQK